MTKGSPNINHIFFADDNIVFCRANTMEWREIQSLLDIYEEVLGQGINKHKTSIFFSSNTDRELRNRILDAVGVTQCNSQEKYLGFPIMVGINKFRTFEAIKGKVWLESIIGRTHFYPKLVKKYY